MVCRGYVLWQFRLFMTPTSDHQWGLGAFIRGQFFIENAQGIYPSHVFKIADMRLQPHLPGGNDFRHILLLNQTRPFITRLYDVSTFSCFPAAYCLPICVSRLLTMSLFCWQIGTDQNLLQRYRRPNQLMVTCLLYIPNHEPFKCDQFLHSW